MAKIKMTALKRFEGLEGKKEKGDSFEVKGKVRADALENRGLAERTKEKEETEQEAASNNDHFPDEYKNEG